jgi:hypothetical protein
VERVSRRAGWDRLDPEAVTQLVHEPRQLSTLYCGQTVVALPVVGFGFDSRHSRTARARDSSGYLFCAATKTPLRPAQQPDVREQLHAGESIVTHPAKPGLTLAHRRCDELWHGTGQHCRRRQGDRGAYVTANGRPCRKA